MHDQLSRKGRRDTPRPDYGTCMAHRREILHWRGSYISATKMAQAEELNHEGFSSVKYIRNPTALLMLEVNEYARGAKPEKIGRA